MVVLGRGAISCERGILVSHRLGMSQVGACGWRVVTVTCSGSEAGWYLRRIDFVYHSTLGLRVIEKKKMVGGNSYGTTHSHEAAKNGAHRNVQWFRDGRVFEAHRLVYHSA